MPDVLVTLQQKLAGGVSTTEEKKRCDTMKKSHWHVRTHARRVCMPLCTARCGVQQSLAKTRYHVIVFRGRVDSLVWCTKWGLTCVYRVVYRYLRIGVCVVVINIISSCASCPVLSDFLLFVLLSGRRPALLASLYFVPSRKRHLARYVCRFALCICTLNRSLNLLVLYFIKSWKTSAVSATVWMVETQLCKLRGTSDTFV